MAATDPQKATINMRTARDKRLINGMIIAITAVLAVVVLSIWQYRRIQDTSGIIRHTNQVLFKADEVLNEMMQYQLNVKNFLLTGRSELLAGRENLPDAGGHTVGGGAMGDSAVVGQGRNGGLLVNWLRQGSGVHSSPGPDAGMRGKRGPDGGNFVHLLPLSI